MLTTTSLHINPLVLCLTLVLLGTGPTIVRAHGLCSDPRQRGALRHHNHGLHTVDWNAPTDFEAHYPAGSKTGVPGAGIESLRRVSHNFWTPYDPFNPHYHWRAGVCGDELDGPQDHLIGGPYYFDGKRVRTYMQGAVVYFESQIITHHNGYIEFFICNLDTCPTDDISPQCFHEGHCTRLLRIIDECESGTNPRCAPVDRSHPGRWYLPCDSSENDQDPMVCGGLDRTMAYLLPPYLVCDHCVIQWYWTSANTCNPPGVHQFFTSRNAPHWGDCPGQGGAIGGWPRNKPECGGELFPEEYYQCADVRILADPNAAAQPPPPPPPPPPRPPPPPPQRGPPPHGAPPPQPPHRPGLRPQGANVPGSGGSTTTNSEGSSFSVAPPPPQSPSHGENRVDEGVEEDMGLGEETVGSSASGSGSSFSASSGGASASGSTDDGAGEPEQPQRRHNPFVHKRKFGAFRRPG